MSLEESTMKARTRKTEELKDLMERETEKLGALAAAENRLQQCILDKDWTELESLIRNLESLSREVSLIENARNQLYGDLQDDYGLETGHGFYDFLVRLPEEQQQDLAELYRRLRIAVSEVRSITGGIDNYISSTVSTMGKILEELFPSRKMRLYGKDGAARESAQPLVFSHCL